MSQSKPHRPWIFVLVLVAMVVSTVVKPSNAQSWPIFRRDLARSGETESQVDLSQLRLAWTWEAELPPDSAWDGPARWDAFARIRDLPAMRQYDACFHPVSDGDSLFFGSSSQDTLFSLSLANGQERWRFVAGGPIRLAPTIVDDHLLFGCDDGFVYCLNRSTGALRWRFSPSRHVGAEQRRVINNDRLISYFPIRTGVSVQSGVAYFGASFLPWRESFLCAIDLATGKLAEPQQHFVRRHDNVTLEGNLLIAGDRLIVPQGRIAPRMFDRRNGEDLKSLPGGGGVVVVLTDTGELVRAEGGRESRPGQVGVFRGKQRVASFPRGRAMVVSGDYFYVIDGEKLFAANRQTNELKWTREVDEPLEVIKVGDTLFVGGRDHVTGVDADSGKTIWSAETAGRAFGLMFAGDKLAVSTDSGSIHAFEVPSATQGQAATPGGDPQARPPASSTDPSKTQLENWQSPSVEHVREKNLLHRWVFHRSAMKLPEGTRPTTTSLKRVQVVDQASGKMLTLVGPAKSGRVASSTKFESIELAGGYFPGEETIRSSLPKSAISLETWVRVDQEQAWGGIVGCLQDDGAVEHGWLLGFRGDQFTLAIAGGGKGLTYLSSPQSFSLEKWHHVVGTYNGSEMRLYVNGALVASSNQESGEISYSDACHFTVGSYRDQNENFPLIGGLQEVRVYAKAISAMEIEQRFRQAAQEFDAHRSATESSGVAARLLSWGPYTRFVEPGKVEIDFETALPIRTELAVVRAEKVERILEQQATRRHHFVLSDLPYQRVLPLQIKPLDAANQDRANQDRANQDLNNLAPPFLFSLDTHFDWTRRAPSQSSPELVDLIAHCANPRGLAIVVGAANAGLAQRLSKQSRFHVVLIVDQERQAESIRRRWSLDPETVYGQHLCVTSERLRSLPAACATLVMATKESAEARRIVRPDGGVLSEGTKVVWRRGKIEGAGTWGHMYGAADNSAFGGESLSNASELADLTTQWIGRPGPRYQTDRQNRKPSPLAAGGRLYLQGHQRMIALDSYSGVVLWSVEAPSVMRWNVPHDCSNWCADETGVYVASNDQAWFINGRDGQVKKRFPLPDLFTSSEAQSATSSQEPAGNPQRVPTAWGFIARHRSQLIGTSVDARASYRKWWGNTQWFDSTQGADTHLVAGNQLFAYDIANETLQWKYRGSILHPTITIKGSSIYFLEDPSKRHAALERGRVAIGAKQALELVCLNLEDGTERFRQRIRLFAGHISSLYLAAGGDPQHQALVMVASEATLKEFRVESFSLETGRTQWTQSIGWEANHHGKHISRPAIQGDLIYVRPEVLQLADGKSIRRGFPGGHGCSSYTLCANGMFARLGETTWWDARTNKVNRFKRIRTDCWISVIPAQGMVLSAEGGGGCSCGSWLEISLGLIPHSVDQELPPHE